MGENEPEMTESIMMEEFGLTAEEAGDAYQAALALLDSPLTQAAFQELEAGAPDVSALSRKLLPVYASPCSQRRGSPWSATKAVTGTRRFTPSRDTSGSC